ncbi:MAG: SH3 domain-containing protein [Desulfovibrio sp.]|uniref:SH3 domain-containing C40 family peptidase n=1 Tax=Desulfovibrio sp. 7SRBS1 TaxID=3378064 RepID=UPI003B3C1E1E
MYHIRNFHLPVLTLPLLAVWLLFSGCTSVRTVADPVDLTTLPQRAEAYFPPEQACTPLMEPAEQQQMYLRFRAYWFGPWEREQPVSRKSLILWPVTAYRKSTLYGANLRPLPEHWLHDMAAKADMEDFPNTRLRGITVTNTSLRALPTDQPAFLDPHKAGEGFPFDYMQNSGVLAGTPLFLAHTSADGQWIFAEAPQASGWIPARDVAFVDDSFADTFRSAPLMAVVRDHSPLHDDFGLFRFQARIGSVLPLLTRSGRGWETLLPVRNIFGKAAAVPAVVSAPNARPMPWPLTKANMAVLLDQMIGQPYGWGGLYGGRDCSASMLDLFIPFGLGLPRNSKDQTNSGEVIRLEGLTPDQKKEQVLEQGRPFMTLLGMPGHIMLYLGEFEGKAVAFHATWGVKTSETLLWGRHKEGRHLVGKGIISTLSLGMELRHAKRPEGDLAYRLTTMTLLGF